MNMFNAHRTGSKRDHQFLSGLNVDSGLETLCGIAAAKPAIRVDACDEGGWLESKHLTTPGVLLCSFEKSGELRVCKDDAHLLQMGSKLLFAESAVEIRHKESPRTMHVCNDIAAPRD